MKKKRLSAAAAAFIMAAAICTGLPVLCDYSAPLTITAEAADEDFVIEDGLLKEYKGSGGDVIIPEGVTSLREGLFDSKSLTNITFPKSCTNLGMYSVCYNKELKTVVFEGDANIGKGAFLDCIRLEGVTVKGSITEQIGEDAFRNCQNLREIRINKNENNFSIGKCAFYNCNSLASINIPDKCSLIDEYAFCNCFELKTLTVPRKTEVRGEGCFGYAVLWSGAGSVLREKPVPFAADGKTQGYDVYGLPVIPKPVTVTVSKGSSAEKWARANKVNYIYADSSSGNAYPAAPANFKAGRTSSIIVLSWDKAEGADIYRVYMYNEKTKKFEKYTDTASEKCNVSGLKANTKYRFIVTSYGKKDGKYVKGADSRPFSVSTK